MTYLFTNYLEDYFLSYWVGLSQETNTGVIISLPLGYPSWSGRRPLRRRLEVGPEDLSQVRKRQPCLGPGVGVKEFDCSKDDGRNTVGPW